MASTCQGISARISQDDARLSTTNALKTLKKTRRNTKRSSTPPPILSSRTRLTSGQISAILKCYAARMAPILAAQKTGISRNTVYAQYERIRWRLLIVEYYTDAAPSADEPGLAPDIRQRLRERRGVRERSVLAHTAELIFWAEEWPPRLVLKHIKRIIALSGTLDTWPVLSETEIERLIAYVRYARTELISHRASENAAADPIAAHFAQRAKAAMEAHYREYRAASKRAERANTGRHNP